MKVLNNFLFKHSERIVGLDILRAIAILIVVSQHGYCFIEDILPKQYLKYNISIDGVSIFFVLSGFLIGNILMKIITDFRFTFNDLINFWIRRWFRTIPNYLLVLLAVLICHFLYYHNSEGFSFKYLFFLQNFSTPHPVFFPEAWSLCVEEWFYLFFPFVCYVLYKLLKNKSKSILYSAIIFLIIPLIWRIIKFESHVGVLNFDRELRKIVVLRLDSIMYGVIGAYVCTNMHTLWTKLKYVGFIAVIILALLLKIMSVNHVHLYLPLHFNIESIAILFLMPFLSELKTTKIRLLDASIIFISIISYSIYLLNLTPVQGFLIPVTNHIFHLKELPKEKLLLLDFVLFWLYTFFGAYLLYHLFEKRITKLRDKIKLRY